MKNTDYLLNHFVFPRKIDARTSPHNFHSFNKPSDKTTHDGLENTSFILLFSKELQVANKTLPNLISAKNRAQLATIFKRWHNYQKWPLLQAELLKDAIGSFREPGDCLPLICEDKNALLIFRVASSEETDAILVNATQLLLPANAFLNDKECPVRNLPDGPTFEVPREKVRSRAKATTP